MIYSLIDWISSHSADIMHKAIIALSSIALPFSVGAIITYIFIQSQPPRAASQVKSKSPEEEKTEPDSWSSSLGVEHVSRKLADYRGCVYLDYNATTCIFPEVTAAMLPYIANSYGNPSSTHIYAEPTKRALETAREHIRALINAASPSTIYFTSCGSESDNRAIDIAIHHFKQWSGEKIAHMVTSAVEHPAILAYLRYLESSNAIELSIIPVNVEGLIDVNELDRHLKSSTALVTCMHSNNEVGTIQPIQHISSLIKRYNAANNTDILFHVDGAQSIGKVRIDVAVEGIDMLTIVGHKYGAPKGIAALYIRDGIRSVSPSIDIAVIVYSTP
jgi:cysteine sulfinate desulfinase/cysteine desulfurase-like protein